ncbi:MAG TPA: bifunctional phosphopantothenoylcysteine decarboxylase/phosphopantothenate--cysteine ligase CoaBC [bacterium]|nr:bifunctional phosphopantothenoylcysteine decarboxylase/phosphopantothenate--cysteine ligase CoaBC [bacterium]
MKVLVGVTSSIAAYKAAEVVSALVKSGAEVSVMMTQNATNLVGPRTFGALTGREVRVDLWEGGTKLPLHLELADEDVVAIVPATANIIGKIACGICDDLVSTVVLSTKAAVVVAPAMNEAMYLNPAVQVNLATLRERGMIVVEPETGWLACGKEGKGRLAATEAILAAILDAAAPRGDLRAKKVIVTGGPTREPLDAVRFISNRSSGKMAVALSRVARRRGAETVLILGPAEVELPGGVKVVRIETGAELRDAIASEWEGADCLVMAAAVCDYKSAAPASGKLKREAKLALELVSTDDILKGFARKKGGRIIVGFALETRDEIEGGKRKLREKDLDLVVVNNPLREGTGFGSDVNGGALIDRDGRVTDLAAMPKLDFSERIFDAVSALLAKPRS